MSGATIEEGNKVILRSGSFMRCEEVRRKIKVNVRRLNFYLDNAIGCKYGTTFKVSKHGHLMVDNTSEELPKLSTSSGENNQFINDDGSSQKLTKDAIMDLKAKGFEGEDIIEQLIENSETFEKKTEFSQEKYLNKKRNRHLSQVTILKPTLRLICEMLYANWASKTLYLRMDTVSQILTMANIHSNINVLLLENTQSFLAGTILHRMAGHGNVVQLYNGDFPIRPLLPHFALDANETKILTGFPMNKINTLHSLKNEASVKAAAEVSSEEKMDTTESREQTAQSCEVHEESTSPTHEEASSNQQRKGKRKKHMNKPLTEQEKHLRKVNKIDEENRALELLKKDTFDSLIIATKFRAKDVVLRLVEFLAPSRPVVVYSQHKEVLSECLIALRENRSVVNLDLTESWLRTYQVLPQRTHPQIMMDGTGGYLLTGIKVDRGLRDNPTDNPGVNPSPAHPLVNPTDPNPSTEGKTDAKSVIPVEDSDVNLVDQDIKSTNFEDNPEITSKPDGDSVEPPVKRAKPS